MDVKKIESAKKKLRIKKYPDTYGQGLRARVPGGIHAFRKTTVVLRIEIQKNKKIRVEKKDF